MLDERWRLEEGYRIDVFDDQDRVGPEEVLALWQREGVVDREEAERRVHEVHLLATDEHGEIAGVSSAYLKRNAQLRMDLWYYRAFVPGAHRMSNVAVNLAVTGRDLLERRFVSGEDPRGGGIIYEVEHEGLKRYFDDAIWVPADVAFIGENERGDHVRVRYFAGALAPEPST
jgi:hypothetical protein